MESVTRDEVEKLWGQLRERHPLIHCITNAVTVNDCANILLAAGASPTMAHHSLEVEEITRNCAALVCNLGATESLPLKFGTEREEELCAMTKAIREASACNHPIVLDPVGVIGSSFRREYAISLLEKKLITCVRGNLSEIQALYQNQTTGAGVDNVETGEVLPQARRAIVKAAANKYGCLVIASGEVDYISDGKVIYEITGGSKWMKVITGGGCMSSCLLGAFLAVEPTIFSATASCKAMRICAEEAEKKISASGEGSMSFRNALIDQVSLFF